MARSVEHIIKDLMTGRMKSSSRYESLKTSIVKTMTGQDTDMKVGNNESDPTPEQNMDTEKNRIEMLRNIKAQQKIKIIDND